MNHHSALLFLLNRRLTPPPKFQNNYPLRPLLTLPRGGEFDHGVLRYDTSSRFIDATTARVLDSVTMASCVVSFVDTEGIRHTVEVEAESLYEAAALAIRTFKQHQCEPGLITKLDVEIRSCITHTVTRKRIHEWLHGGAKSPREAVLKERLRDLLEAEIHVQSAPSK